MVPQGLRQDSRETLAVWTSGLLLGRRKAGSSSPSRALQTLCAAQPPRELRVGCAEHLVASGVGEGPQGSSCRVFIGVSRQVYLAQSVVAPLAPQGGGCRQPRLFSGVALGVLSILAPGAALADGVMGVREGLPHSPPPRLSAPWDSAICPQSLTRASQTSHLSAGPAPSWHLRRGSASSSPPATPQAAAGLPSPAPTQSDSC